MLTRVYRSNPIRQREDGACEIPLTRGYVALVDSGDVASVAPYRWHVDLRIRGGQPFGYAASIQGGRKVYMHRLILGAPRGMDVDHENRDGLDNRRCNIRVATRSQNIGRASRKAG